MNVPQSLVASKMRRKEREKKKNKLYIYGKIYQC